MTNGVRNVAKQAFQGDGASNQLSFLKGEIILYDPSHEQRNGWVWCTIPRTAQSGWCPLSFLAQEGPTSPPPASAPPRAPLTPKERLSQIGSGIQNVGMKSWTAVSNGAQAAGQYTQKTLQESKERYAEYQNRQQPKDAQTPSWVKSDNHEKQSWTNKQQAHFAKEGPAIGNYAARGAVVGAVHQVVFGGPSVVGMARSATRGAVSGGTWGAVRKWKPFGEHN